MKDRILNVLITGAASGIGAQSAILFAENGHNVYGIDVSPCPDCKGITAYKADITDGEALNGIKNELESRGIIIDLIINVAGVHTMASLAEDDIAHMKRVLEINLVGTLTVNRIFHSLLATHGRIVIVTSEVAPLAPMPFNGLYNVSKTALDCYAQALRQEIGLIGQKVITIRPGAIETPLAHGSLKATQALADRTRLYKKQASRFLGLTKSFMGTPIKPSKRAALIYKAAISEHPRTVYSKHRNPGLVLLSILPADLQCFIIKMLLGNT